MEGSLYTEVLSRLGFKVGLKLTSSNIDIVTTLSSGGKISSLRFESGESPSPESDFIRCVIGKLGVMFTNKGTRFS